MEENMSEIIIDEKVKSYLVACLVTGIDVEQKPDILMRGLVEYMNKIERPYWTEGDEDGVIINNQHDAPILYVTYNGQRLTFRTVDEDEFTAFESRKCIGFSLLNIISYLNSIETEFRPSILGSEAFVIHQATEDRESEESNLEDWAL